jgi:hypothetical protein
MPGSDLDRRVMTTFAAVLLALLWPTLITAAWANAADPEPPRVIAPELASSILALQPDHISEKDLTELLARAPAPKVFCFDGSPAFVTMGSFARFLVAMGYPESALRNPQNGRYSYSGRLDAERVAGMVGWYYERDAMMPMLIGHSRGGLLVLQVLYSLADRSTSVAVWNPLLDQAEPRYTIRDPLNGDERAIAGLQLSYAAVLATGKLARLLLGQWGDLARLRKIPDSVSEFTGFQIRWDLIAGSSGNPEPYRPLNAARVRNVLLPSSVSHIDLPRARHLADNPTTRAWISAYVPGTSAAPPDVPGVDTTNILHAADIWFSIKRHWCLEAQRLIRVRTAAAGRR